jgi:hypothetical protein
MRSDHALIFFLDERLGRNRRKRSRPVFGSAPFWYSGSDFHKGAKTWEVAVIASCASEDCGKPANHIFDAGGVRSFYCDECWQKLPHGEAIKRYAVFDGEKLVPVPPRTLKNF